MNLMIAPVSFQRLGEWHDTCISNSEAGEGRPPRTRSDSNGNVKGFESGDALHYEGG